MPKDIIDETVDQIQKVRATNNRLWMGLLKLSLNASPEKAKRILMKINSNDMKISELIQRLK